MFKQLYEIARHTPLHLIITPNGPQLRIIVTPKPSGTGDSSALAKPFSVAGTPEELDAEFPGAIQQYTSAVNEIRASLDLPLDALEAEKKKTARKEEAKAEKARKEKEEQERRSTAAKAAAETRAANAKKAAEEAEAKKRAQAEKRAAKKNPPAALPGATEPLPSSKAPQAAAWPFPTGSSVPAEPETQHRQGLPGKEDCVRDYQQLKLKHGDKLTRRLFIKKAQTGRRYEKLWANWAKFVKEAETQQQLPLDDTLSQAEPEQKGTYPIVPILPVEDSAAPVADAGAAAQEQPEGAAAAELTAEATQNGTTASPGARGSTRCCLSRPRPRARSYATPPCAGKASSAG